jgi:uncharacterized protein (TIGR00251 family)
VTNHSALLAARITVRVQPKASRNACVVDDAGRIRVALTAPPVDGAANEALMRFLSDLLGLPRRTIRILSGEKSRDKTLSIEGTSTESVLERLRASG